MLMVTDVLSGVVSMGMPFLYQVILVGGEYLVEAEILK